MHFRNIFLITRLGAIVTLTTEVIGRTLRRYAVDSLSTCITAIGGCTFLPTVGWQPGESSVYMDTPVNDDIRHCAIRGPGGVGERGLGWVGKKD